MPAAAAPGHITAQIRRKRILKKPYFEIPDAVITIAGVPSPVLTTLIQRRQSRHRARKMAVSAVPSLKPPSRLRMQFPSSILALLRLFPSPESIFH